MHSSRMRTARSSSRPGGSAQGTRHAGIPPAMHAGIPPPPCEQNDRQAQKY